MRDLRIGVAGGALVLAITVAEPAGALTTTRDLVKRDTVTVAGCNRPATVRVNAPKGARDLKAMGPAVGEQLKDRDGRTIARIVGVLVGKRGITWGALGSDLSCENPGYVGGGPRTSGEVEFTLRYTINEKIFLPRRCAKGSHRPSFVTLDCKTRRVRLSRIRWSSYDQARARGTASLRTTAPGRLERRQNARIRAENATRCGTRLVYRTIRVTAAGKTKTYRLPCRP